MSISKTKNLAVNGLLMALVFVAAQAINIPTPIGGVINLSDSIILVVSVITTKHNATIISGGGAFLAEVFSPYAIFAPATLIIKSSMAYISSTISNITFIKNRSLRLLLAFVVAELIMISGYFIYQAFFLNLGMATASLDIVNNIIQATSSIIIAFTLTHMIERVIS